MNEPRPASPDSRYTTQTIVEKRVWSDGKLFSLRTTRDEAFSFIPGQFARLGLTIKTDGASETEGAMPIEWRAYSMVSAPDDPHLEFFSVIVPDGKFSPAMAKLEIGQPLLIDKSVFGFLTLDRFADGEDLWLICTGTGLSAYLAMLRESNTWIKFKKVILVHGVRHANELAYREELLNYISAGRPLHYIPVTSQEHTLATLSPHAHASLTSPARITTLTASGELERRAQIKLDPTHSRVMLCGNPAMVADMRAILAQRGFAPGRRGVAGNLAVENYW